MKSTTLYSLIKTNNTFQTMQQPTLDNQVISNDICHYMKIILLDNVGITNKTRVTI
jgi:hypothetical protein